MKRFVFSEVIFPGVRGGILADAIEAEAMQQLHRECEERGPDFAYVTRPEDRALLAEALTCLPDGFFLARLAPIWAKQTAYLFLGAGIANARPLVSRSGLAMIQFDMPEGPIRRIWNAATCGQVTGFPEFTDYARAELERRSPMLAALPGPEKWGRDPLKWEGWQQTLLIEWGLLSGYNPSGAEYEPEDILEDLQSEGWIQTAVADALEYFRDACPAIDELLYRKDRTA